MFKNFLEKLKSLSAQKSAFDPSRFNDPIALQTQWTPAKSGGTNIRTHKLVEVEANRMEFKAAVGAKIFYSVFIIMGSAAMIGIPYAHISSGGETFDSALIVPSLLGLLFVGIGITVFYFGVRPIVFDKFRNAFWKGRKGPDDVSDRRELKYYAELQNVHALQIISEYVHSSKSSYYSYELNLVLKDGKRINVVDHGNLKKLREDADTLSKFLGKPVWDAIG